MISSMSVKLTENKSCQVVERVVFGLFLRFLLTKFPSTLKSKLEYIWGMADSWLFPFFVLV